MEISSSFGLFLSGDISDFTIKVKSASYFWVTQQCAVQCRLFSWKREHKELQIRLRIIYWVRNGSAVSKLISARRDFSPIPTPGERQFWSRGKGKQRIRHKCLVTLLFHSIIEFSRIDKLVFYLYSCLSDASRSSSPDTAASQRILVAFDHHSESSNTFDDKTQPLFL